MPTSSSAWHLPLHNVLSHIQIHYAEEITVSKLEDISCYSYRNLQRIMVAHTGETTATFQRRIRLENASKLLLFSNRQITDIAMAVGFEESASFCKAFKQLYGISPSTLRDKRIKILNKELSCNKKIPSIDISIVYLPKLAIWYRSVQTDYHTESINTLWQQFYKHGLSAKETECYGIIADESLITSPLKTRYEAAILHPLTDLPLASKTIFGGKFAKIVHKGDYDSLLQTYNQIYLHLLENHLSIQAGAMIEKYIYSNFNTQNPADYVTEILIPLSD